MKHYLGLDYGREHVGVAVGMGTLVTPLTTVSLLPYDVLVRELLRYVEEYTVCGLVIGITDGILTEEMEQFAVMLKERLGLPVYFIEEQDSTREARTRAREAGKQLRALGKKEHSWAAAVVLERWLESGREE